jgi:hypothetical protein
MANIAAIRSVGSSLAAYLNNAYRDAFSARCPQAGMQIPADIVGGVARRMSVQ